MATTRDKNIWLFNAGSTFSGNPKWLFLYIQEHFPEIECYWLCYRSGLVRKIRDLGFKAYLYRSGQARVIGSKAGVYVVEQNKEVFQDYLDGITVLNLWHGVTVKKLEHAVDAGFMEEGLAAKHIRNEPVYRQQLMLATSEEQESVFIEQCKVPSNQIVRAASPRCFERVATCTYDHDIRARQGLGPDTKVALYAPTFRDFDRSSFFAKAIPDAEALISRLARNGWLLVIKAHPQMEDDFQLKALKCRYGDSPYLLFWDVDDDIYEIIDSFDMAIVDYSSILFDLIACGCKRFVRYIFDYEDKEHLREFAFDYLEVTCGEVCADFSSLLDVFAYDEPTDPAEVGRVFDWAWGYAREHPVREIIERALAYKPDVGAPLPVLYSFDVFDTLIARASGDPESVFRYVQDKIQRSDADFPSYLKHDYVEARMGAERNCRQLVERMREQRGDERTEITFDMIFDRLRDLYGLDDFQIACLREWELECEYHVSVPVEDNVTEVLKLVEQGESVLLISDMYLPQDFVTRLLGKADERLAALPLFLSSATGRQKTKRGLFLDAYHSLDYRYSKWVHTGDNKLADVRMPKKLGIEAVWYKPEEKSGRYEQELVKRIATYDACLVGRLISRLAAQCESQEEVFACAYASLYFVPYVSWVVRDAAKRGIEHLYFISRDGYHLKHIADVLIERFRLPIETSYIYGSRKAWRLPSQIHEVDDDFFSSYGSFTGVGDYRSLLSASGMDAASFASLFPELAYLEGPAKISRAQRDRVVERLRSSRTYRDYVIRRAAEQREIVLDYLRQETDFSQRFAFVEYWGRGYTQTCHSRLLQAADVRSGGTTYYYARSILPSQGPDVRLNFSPNANSLLFVEALFANMPYRTVEGYRRDGDRVVPSIEKADFNEALFKAFEEWLPRFARAYGELDFVDEDRIARELFDFGVDYMNAHQSDKLFLRCIAPLADSITINAKPSEYAPRLGASLLMKYAKGAGASTKSKRMTVARANPLARFLVSRYEAHRFK